MFEDDDYPNPANACLLQMLNFATSCEVLAKCAPFHTLVGVSPATVERLHLSFAPGCRLN